MSAAATSARRRVLEAALVVVALWYLGAYLAVALARIGYPYDLEWMEGGSLEHVARVLRGQPLYVPPSLEFTPYIYAPLYYYVAAPFAYSPVSTYAPPRFPIWNATRRGEPVSRASARAR